MRLGPWLLVALLGSCGSTESKVKSAPVAEQPSPPAECTLGAAQPSVAGDDFALATGLDYASCGRQSRAREPACCAATTAGYDCLVAALAACSPARLSQISGTVEGDAIFEDYFVVPLASGCEVVVVTDNGQDGYRDPSYPPVSKRHCGVARTRAAANADTCPTLDLSACSQ